MSLQGSLFPQVIQVKQTCDVYLHNSQVVNIAALITSLLAKQSYNWPGYRFSQSMQTRRVELKNLRGASVVCS